jgi:hypothetical protein
MWWPLRLLSTEAITQSDIANVYKRARRSLGAGEVSP